MKKNFAAILILCSLFGTEIVQSQDPITAATKIAGMKVLATDLIQEGEKAGVVLIKEAGVEMQRVIDRLEKALGDNIGKPLEQLDSTLRSELNAAEYMINSLKNSAEQIPSCIGNEGEVLLANYVMKLEVHKSKGFLHVLDMGRTIIQMSLTLP